MNDDIINQLYTQSYWREILGPKPGITLPIGGTPSNWWTLSDPTALNYPTVSPSFHLHPIPAFVPQDYFQGPAPAPPSHPCKLWEWAGYPCPVRTAPATGQFV